MRKNDPDLPLLGGVAAAIGAGLCCVAPFVLVSLGIGGAWVSSLTRLEPYRPLLIAVALGLFAWAAWRLYRPIAQCRPGDPCADPRVRRRRRWIFWCAALCALVLIAGPYWIPLIA